MEGKGGQIKRGKPEMPLIAGLGIGVCHRVFEARSRSWNTKGKPSMGPLDPKKVCGLWGDLLEISMGNHPLGPPVISALLPFFLGGVPLLK